MDNPPDLPICFPSILTDFEEGFSASSVKTAIYYQYIINPRSWRLEVVGARKNAHFFQVYHHSNQ